MTARWWAAWILVAGCSRPGFQPLNRTALRAGQPRTLAVAHSPSPRLSVRGTQGPNPFAMGLLSVLARPGDDPSAAAKARRKRLVDPAVMIRETIADALAKRFSLEVADTEETRPRGSSVSDLMNTYPGVDLILDIRTSQWGVTRSYLNNPNDQRHFGIFYEGTLRLIDARQKAVIAEANCTSDPVNAPGMPTFEELMEDHAALLKIELATTAEYCSDDYRKRVLGLY